MANLVDQLAERQNAIVLQSNDLGLSTLAQWVESGIIDVAPDFQRRDRWNSEKQSKLIESFLLNLPIPPVYLAEANTGEYSVIDGRQRLTAIHAFMIGELELKGLEELPELEGMTLSSMPRGIAAQLGMRPLRTVTLLNQTDPEAKYLVFHRLNSAGEVLNAQEIRNVAYRGPLNDLIHELAEDDFLRQQLKITGDTSAAFRKMQDLEYVLRFLTLRDGWREFSGDLARSMDDYMARNQYPSEAFISRVKRDFGRTIQQVERIFGDHAFHRPDGAGWRDQSLAGLYDAEMVAISELGDQELDAVSDFGGAEIIRRLFDDGEFESAVRSGTNTPSRVRYRVREVIEALQGGAQE